MAKVGAQRASELTGRSKSTIQRAMNNGRLSYEIDSAGRRVIDVSELERAFGLGNPAEQPDRHVEYELEKATSLLETERLKMQIRALQDQTDLLNTQMEDLRAQRDQWQKQASQMLITSQYSQKQAEELRQEIKEREQRARERQQSRLDQRMQALNAQNENIQSGQDGAFNFRNFWKKIRKAG
ncbi:MAG: entry exclusion 1 domain-containing protein [Alphaproteobacteria bacterium]|nr:entry exclusion 1 domain-containing protein [Alphaproteobacteria bacterium]